MIYRKILSKAKIHRYKACIAVAQFIELFCFILLSNLGNFKGGNVMFLKIMYKFRRNLFLFSIVGCLLFICFTKVLAASFDLDVKWNPATSPGSNDLSWSSTGITLSTETAKEFYDIYRTFGYKAGADGWTLIASAYYGTSFTDYCGYGTYSYYLDAWDDGNDGEGGTLGGYPKKIATSITAASTFIHSMERGDAEGEQVGYGQQWNFAYKLQADSYVNIAVFEPETASTTDAEGFVNRPGINLVKTIVDIDTLYSAARSFEMAGSTFKNEDMWDCRDSSGCVVKNGVYWILFEAYAPSDHTELRDTWWGTIPVDILRIMDLDSEAITETQLLAKINYTITGDATVKIIICKPGTAFKLASESGNLTYLDAYTYDYVTGDVLPLDPTTYVVDGTRLLKYFKFGRKHGSYSEPWGGRDDNGLILDNDLYVFGISAVDGYGNHALDPYGNDRPIYNTIPIDRTAAEHATDVTKPSVGPFTPADESVVNPPLVSVSAVLSDDVGIDWTKSTIALSGPGGAVTGTTSNDGTSIIFTPDIPQSTLGSYYISVKAVDTSNNETNEVSELIIQAGNGDVPPPEFEESVYAFPNPVKTERVNIAYTLTGSYKVSIDIYDIMGKLIWSEKKDASDASYSVWHLQNESGNSIASGVYIYRVKLDNGSDVYKTVKKLIVIR